MKKAESYIDSSDWDNMWSWNIEEVVVGIIKQVQIDTIRETCTRCAENVKFCTEGFIDKDGLWDTKEINEIDLNSIYEVADKMEEELNETI